VLALAHRPSPLQWGLANYVAVVFDVGSKASFASVTKWARRAQDARAASESPALAGKPIAGVLIGAKSDFRDDSTGLSRAEVSAEDAAALAASLGLAYFEVSAVRWPLLLPWLAWKGGCGRAGGEARDALRVPTAVVGEADSAADHAACHRRVCGARAPHVLQPHASLCPFASLTHCCSCVLQETGTGYDKPFQHIARLVQKAYETEVSHAAELVSR